ncbi:type II toxin-antitoxin system RelE/ParE family toxin [candidate division KSB1 bacterium]|nr:type II toxin-antitoxin system RelE/ParE family toxin [candidate division KSB1 bacterium]
MREKSIPYKILYSEPAITDLENIIEYLVAYSGTSADKFIDDFDSKTNLLKSFPKIGSFPQIPNLKKKGYRILILKYKFLLFYTIDEKAQSIMVERILHGARDLMVI